MVFVLENLENLEGFICSGAEWHKPAVSCKKRLILWLPMVMPTVYESTELGLYSNEPSWRTKASMRHVLPTSGSPTTMHLTGMPAMLRSPILRPAHVLLCLRGSALCSLLVLPDALPIR